MTDPRATDQSADDTPDRQVVARSTDEMLPPPPGDSTDDVLPPPPPGDSTDEMLPPPPGELVAQPPRAGELTTGWRIITTCTWIAVIVAFAAVWSTSVQLGLSTWWLGARAEPRPLVVRLLPFVAPTIVVLATFNNARWLAWWGMGAAVVTAAVGLGDLGRVWELAVLELVIAGLAFLVALASLTGTFRPLATEPTS